MTKQISIPRIEVPVDRYFTANSELYKETQAKTKEKFGENSQAYKTIMNGINPEKATGSQFFFNNEMNLYLPKGQKVIMLDGLERIYSSSEADNLFDGSFYTDTPEIILRTETASLERNKQLLENLVKQVKAQDYGFSSENPLRISNFELIKDDNEDNEYGILLNIGDNTKMINDKRFAYSKNTIQLGNQTKKLYTKEKGLSRLYVGRNRGLDFGNDDLGGSGSDGRVVVIDAGGVAPQNFEVKLKELEQEKQKQINQINKRYTQALKILKGQ